MQKKISYGNNMSSHGFCLLICVVYYCDESNIKLAL